MRQAGSLCRDPGTLVKRNKNQLCHYTKTEPVWLAVIPLLWCWDLGWALIERGGLLTFFPWKEGGLIVDLRYSHTLSQSKLLENHIQTTVISHRRRKRFFSSAGLRWHNAGFCDKSIVFQERPARPVMNQLWFLKRPFLANSIYLRLGEVQIATNENLWEIVASSPFLGQQVRVASGRNVANYHILWSRNITLF